MKDDLETMAEIYFAITEPVPLPSAAQRIANRGRRADIASALRHRAEALRRGAPSGWGIDCRHGRCRVLDRAAGLEHLALLVEHHDAFLNVPEHRMPPCEFARLQLMPEPRRLGASSSDFAGQDR